MGIGGYKIALIEEVKDAWKFSSLRFLALGTACEMAVVKCPVQIAQHVPEWVFQSLSTFSLVCMVLAGVGRITKVEKTNVPPV